MRYSLTFKETDYKCLTSHLFNTSAEAAAYLLARISSTDQETRLLVREVLPVKAEDIVETSSDGMVIAPRSFLRAIKRADESAQCFVFVHSHPGPDSPRGHSGQDDQEEAKLFRTAYIRIGTVGVHASVVFAGAGTPIGRVWLKGEPNPKPMAYIRSIGSRFRFYFPPGGGRVADSRIFDRQVRAFGRDLQPLLRQLTVGIVGCGGTGSCVTEQLIRLGVGSLYLFDGQLLDVSNVTRCYGSRAVDCGIPKVKLLERLAADIGLCTQMTPVPRDITFESSAQLLRDCDVVFGCTDDEWGRALLCRLATYYYIPVFDMGVKIDSESGRVRSVQGRVTTLMPGAACLFCRNRITAGGIGHQAMAAVNPGEAEERRREGYAPELQEAAPSVISFTTGIAASAVAELLHRLTGFMDPERTSTEVLHLFDQSRVRTNAVEPREDCFCNSVRSLGRGDTRPLLDSTWRSE